MTFKVLILFGSESDHKIFNPLIESLKTLNQIEVDLNVLSAHRNPKELDLRLQKDDFQLIIAGAGLAAHLPGVVASKTKCPVLGLPVSSQFSGLDAFSSIVQMPFGVPVMCFGPDSHLPIVEFLSYVLTLKSPSLHLMIPEHLASLDTWPKEKARLEELLTKERINYTQGPSYNHQALNINFISSQKDIHTAPCLRAPILNESAKNGTEGLLQMFQWSQKAGGWFGCNNSRNAVLFYQKLLEVCP